MKRNILLLLMTVALFVFAGCRLYDRSETWLKTEQNGLCYELDYLHRLAEQKPGKSREYLGASISFAAELRAVYDKVEISPYGNFDRILCFESAEGKYIFADSSLSDYDVYEAGEKLIVHGKITAITENYILLLNAYGSPGFPNKISIEKANKSIMP